MPVYGDGKNVRDWIHVEDHANGVRLALENGYPGGVYDLGGDAELENIVLVEKICALLDKKRPKNGSYREQVSFVTDRPGHDRRYSLSSEKARALGRSAQVRFAEGLEETVAWYRENAWWWEPIRSGDYRAYYERQYGRALS